MDCKDCIAFTGTKCKITGRKIKNKNTYPKWFKRCVMVVNGGDIGIFKRLALWFALVAKEKESTHKQHNAKGGN
jgi:hypothetical protein